MTTFVSEIDRMVKQIAEGIQKTGQATPSAVRKFLFSTELSKEEEKILVIEALSARVNAFLTQGKLVIQERSEEYEKEFNEYCPVGEIKPEITLLPRPVVHYDVEVKILHSTMFDIAGTRKAIITFGCYELDYMISQYKAAKIGLDKRTEVFQYAKDRLKTLGKKKISDLAAGEQSKLARKWKTAASKQLDLAE